MCLLPTWRGCQLAGFCGERRKVQTTMRCMRVPGSRHMPVTAGSISADSISPKGTAGGDSSGSNGSTLEQLWGTAAVMVRDGRRDYVCRPISGPTIKLCCCGRRRHPLAATTRRRCQQQPRWLPTALASHAGHAAASDFITPAGTAMQNPEAGGQVGSGTDGSNAFHRH